MSHEMETMFSVKEVPWHKLGKIVQEAPNAEEAIKLAGLDWTVGLKNLVTTEGIPVPQMAVIRESDNGVLGVVGKNWTPVQNTKAFSFFDPFVDSGECTFETAGSLMNGKKVWILAKINRKPMQIAKGDEVAKYVMLSNGHDGLTAVKVGFTPIRIVCANTLRMAEGERKGNALLSIRHKQTVNEALDKVRDIVNVADQRFEATAEQYRQMLKMNVSKGTIDRFVKEVFFTHEEIKQRQEVRLEKMTETITRLFETGYGNNLKNVSGTGWALYNAATQYLSYDSGRTEDTRLNGLWFGGMQATQNKKAFDFVMSQVGG